METWPTFSGDLGAKNASKGCENQNSKHFLHVFVCWCVDSSNGFMRWIWLVELSIFILLMGRTLISVWRETWHQEWSWESRRWYTRGFSQVFRCDLMVWSSVLVDVLFNLVFFCFVYVGKIYLLCPVLGVCLSICLFLFFRLIESILGEGVVFSLCFLLRLVDSK